MIKGDDDGGAVGVGGDDDDDAYLIASRITSFYDII